MLLPTDLEQSLDRLLRNQIEGLGWDYFAIDLDTAAADPRARAGEGEVRAFFASLGTSEEPVAMDVQMSEQALERVVDTHTANEAMAYFFALLRLDEAALATFIRQQLTSKALVNRSAADTGTLGRLNARERRRRNRAYSRKIDAGHRARDGALVVLAEGDSWFQFPKLYVFRPVKDLILYLLDDPKYAVKTLAAGGDWLASIADRDEHLAALAETRPDVLLLSGGGNDLVGQGGLKKMVRSAAPQDALPPRLRRLLDRRARDAPADLNLARYRNGLRHVDTTYLDFLNQYFLVYFHLIYQLHRGEHSADVLIVTQGYDYLLPAPRNTGGWLKRLVNRAVGNGEWLHQPLLEAGIPDLQDQRDVLYALIYEFNEMLITLAHYAGFGNLRHLDVRGFAGEDDWYDELHLRSPKNMRLAENYQALITSELSVWCGEVGARVWKVR